MTIKATFPDGTVRLFGDSYRKWYDQLREYCGHYEKPRPDVVKCKTAWISYGGLKWCALHELTSELKEEGQGRSVSDFADWKPLNQIERRTLEKYVPKSNQP